MIPQLQAVENILIEPGYRQVYLPARADPFIAPEQARLDGLKEGQSVRPRTITVTRQVAPNGISEADLVELLQTNGLGRPATYAGIIESLVDRRYLDRDAGGRLSPTFRGREACQFLIRAYPDLFDPAFTAQMEAELDRVACGLVDYFDVLQTVLLKLEKAQ